MTPFTLIWRHRKENRNKCSLRPLEGRSDIHFYTYPTDVLPDLSHYLLLKVGAPLLSPEDNARGLFLIDATWRLAYVMEKQLRQPVLCRSLPTHYRTAYPRRQTDCPDPSSGLSSIEALYLAYLLLGRNPHGLLDQYHWKLDFLEKNQLHDQPALLLSRSSQ